MRAQRACAFTALLAVYGCGSSSHSGPDNKQGDRIVVAEADDLRTSEAGTSATFTIALGRKPTAHVTVPLSSSDSSEGKVAPSLLTFTPDNWNAPQSVFITGVDDDLADHDVKYHVVLGALESDDTSFAGFDPDDVPVTNIDDDTPGVTVTPRAGLSTTESGGSAEFGVVLHAQPAADVTIAIESDTPGEGTASPASLTFTTSNWNAPQLVVVTGVDDDAADGAKEYTVRVGPITSDDEGYAAIDPDDVTLTNVDNDSPGIQLTLTDAKSGEDGATGAISVRLNTKPSADVVITVNVSDASEASASPATLTFTTDNWNSAQSALLTGVDDSLVDGDQNYQVSLSVSSSDVGYDKLTVAPVTLSNVDNDSAGITVQVTDDTSGENGASASVSYVLNSQPTADVVLTLAISDASEGAAAPTSLTFTPSNWNAPQVVTITGVDDHLEDGDQIYELRVTSIDSSDERYSALAVAHVALRNIDDDSAGITVTVVDASSAEDGATADVTYVLNSQPTGDVVVSLASSNTSEGVASPTSLTFTHDNWASPQHVYVTGQDDDLTDGDQSYQLQVTSVSSSDPRYDGLVVAAAELTNLDLDSPGVLVNVLVDTSSEAGAHADVTYALRTQPTADVVLALESSDASEGSAAPTTLTFTTSNWASPQHVYVTGQSDDIADGDQPYKLRVSSVASSDMGYDGLAVAEADLTNVDDDSAGITVTTIDATSAEDGAQAHATYVLHSQPTADVVLTLGSSDASEGAVSPTTLTFTPDNWAAPQHVYVTGQDDDVADGDQPYELRVTTVASSDSGYDGRAVAAVTLTNVDDDSPGITVNVVQPNSSECCGQAEVTYVLNSQPTADVVISFESSDTSEGVVTPATLTFTSDNWSAPQHVYVQGQDDHVADGNVPYELRVTAVRSDDSLYDGRSVGAVALTNLDDDSAGIRVDEADVTTSEGGGQARVGFVLNSEPTADVVFTLAISDATEGSASTTTLTFTASNWNAPQYVDITGVNDDVADGDQIYKLQVTLVTSEDANYANSIVAPVPLTNTDNDVAGITVAALDTVSGENGATADVTYVLNSEPTADVVLTIASSDSSEGIAAPATLTFTPMNWAAPQHVIITGQNDAVADGQQAYELRVTSVASTDANYDGQAVGAVALTNTDDDVAGITVKTIDAVAGEDGATADVTYVLNSEPTANVTLTLASSDVSEGTPSPTTLTFTPSNWSSAQHVIVTGQDDDLADGNQVFKLNVTAVASSDTKYSGMSVNGVSLTTVDNDMPGFSVSAISAHTTEAGGTATFTVRLNSQPFADVTLHLASNDLTEGTLDVSSLTFTAANWSTDQTVTVTGINDHVADGNQPYTIVWSDTTSSDAAYAALKPANVAVINDDNDAAGISVSAVTGNTTEAGGTAAFTIVLTSQPSASVTVHFASNDVTEGTTNVTSRTFNTSNWNVVQSVTVTGVDDADFDGDVTYGIVFSPTTSGDPAYNGTTPSTLSVTNSDDEFDEYTFVDTAADDVAATSLYSWFNARTLASTDYIYVEVSGTTLGGGGSAWCSTRADWYKTEYLARATGGSSVASGAWNKWTRSQLSGAWSGVTTASGTNHYGSDCGGAAYNWCAEFNLQSLSLAVMPANWAGGGNTEIYATGAFGTSLGLRARVRTARSRFGACGF